MFKQCKIGIKDKCGVDIREGDILAYHNKNSPRNGTIKGYIVYNKCAFRVKRTEPNKEKVDNTIAFSYRKMHKVVGSIYDGEPSMEYCKECNVFIVDDDSPLAENNH